MKTYTPEFRDAPVSTRDLIQAERKAGRWSKAMDLIKAEAKRRGVIAQARDSVQFDMAKAPLWLCDELASTYMGALCWEDAQAVLLLVARALEQMPGNERNLAMTWRKLGQCCEVQGDYQAAMLSYKKGVDLIRSGVMWEDDSRLWVHYGAGLFRAGRISEGEDAWRESLRRKCTSVEARYSRAQIKLALGMWEEGWAEYESRKEIQGYEGAIKMRGNVPSLPSWDGLSRGRVLCVMGQGAGDVIQFSRYIPAIARSSGWTPQIMAGEPLMGFLGFTNGMSWLTECRYLMHLDSAPFLLRSPKPIPPCEIEPWWRPSNAKPRVGVCWKGASAHLNDKDRSSPFDPRPDLCDERWDIVSLQHGHDFHPKDYAETAEYMRTLDAVVTVDTSVCHVAGTLGVPTIMIPPSAPEWRWGTRGETTDWYPSMTLVRRKNVHAWEDAWMRAKAKLVEVL